MSSRLVDQVQMKTATAVPPRRRTIVILPVAALVAALVVAAGVTIAGLLERPATPDQSTTAHAGRLTFAVDHTLRPSVSQVEPVEGGTEHRPVGVLAGPEGSTAELVRDEVIVHVGDEAELAGFLARWDGVVLDSFPPDEDGQDHLVRVDAGRADPAGLAADLLAVEPDQAGGYRVSDEGVLQLLALAAAEWRAGTEVVIDWLLEPTGIEDGEVYESSDITQDGAPKNVFDWSYMRVGGPMDTGVAAAWQLLEAEGKLTPQIRYMVADRGFNSNFDFPADRKLRKTEWSKRNDRNCSSGKPCPWHGTDVVMAAMAKVGNEYGTAGPAGPVVSQLVAVGLPVDYWAKMRRLEAMAEEHRPDVINYSYTRDVGVGGDHAKRWTDRRMRNVARTGALIVASAGNNGRTVDGDTLWVPCESRYVMCVGGMSSSGARDPDSNYGQGDSPTSVEIYGPYCVRSVDPEVPAPGKNTRSACGTSFASPFVGAVAALVMAADPTLGSEEVRRILNDTAHVGGLGSEVTGSQRRVNALQAVARALGVDLRPPAISIDAPANGRELGVEDWVDLRGTATDLYGRDLPIRWESDLDGFLDDAAVTSVPPLSLGTHVITASATDFAGQTVTAQVTVKVVDTPPEVAIVSPPAGLEVLESTRVPLVATTVDPDTWSALPDGETEWKVRRGGAVVHTATGHDAAIPAAKVTPGNYTVRFTAGGVTAEAAFTVTAIPPGQTKPVATITAPEAGLTFYNEAAKAIAFAGTGTDAEDGTVPATRYRWVAKSGTHVKVLCEGSNVPDDEPPDGPILTQPTSCDSFTAELELLGDPIAKWVVWLEVYDSTGLAGTDSVDVTIQHVVG